MYFYVIFSELKALFPLVYLLVSKSSNSNRMGQINDNSRMGPDPIYGKWGVIKAGTDARYRN